MFPQTKAERYHIEKHIQTKTSNILVSWVEMRVTNSVISCEGESES